MLQMKRRLVICVAAATLVCAIHTDSKSQDPPAQLNRFVEGVDPDETPMPADQAAAELNDPWGVLVLRKGVFPNTIEDALKAIDGLGQCTSTEDKDSNFFVSESGRIPANVVPGPGREFRMVICRTVPNTSSVIFMSTPAGDRSGFIELMSWDESKKAFNFYRRPRAPSWDWKGDTNAAFATGSAGNGCFACHVHGVPLIKELHRPWNNWQSEVSTIPPEAIPDQTIRDGPLFTRRSDFNLLGPFISNWMRIGVAAHVAAAVKGGTLSAAPDLLRPLFETTIVNLDSSQSESVSFRNLPLDLPFSFFLNNDLLGNVLEIDLSGLGTSPTVARNLYQAALTKFDFHLGDDTTGFSRPGDTFFAFFVPVAAFADTLTVDQLIKLNAVTWHFATSVAMVDFPNPVFSALRSSLLQYVPASAPAGGKDFCQTIADKILAAAATLPADSAERRFADYWNLSDDGLKARAAKDLADYFASVRQRLGTSDGFDDYTRLAQSRRDRFAQSDLDESELKLLLPKTNIPPADLRMNADGTVTP